MIKRRKAFIIPIVLLITVTTLSGSLTGCINLPTKSPTNTSTMALEEKSLPPVFSNMNTLWGKYFSSLIFPPDDHSDLVFSRHPIQATKPEELTIDSSLPAVPDKLIVYKVIRPVVDETFASNLVQRIGLTGEMIFSNVDNTYRIYFGDGTDGEGISIYKDGKISIWYERDRRHVSSLPSDEECINIAQNWLKSHDLYPKNVINIETTLETVAIRTGLTTGPFYPYATLVNFSIGLDGYN